VNELKRLHPSLSKLVAQLIYSKHKEQAAREVAEMRAVLAELIRRGKSSEELVATLMGTTVQPSNTFNKE
jgi:hypothetical protein